MSTLLTRPQNLTDEELIDLATEYDRDTLIHELAVRLELLLPCEENCVCDTCLSLRMLDDMEDLDSKVRELEDQVEDLERLLCGYDEVTPNSIRTLIKLGEACIVNIAAAIGYEVKDWEGDL